MTILSMNIFSIPANLVGLWKRSCSYAYLAGIVAIFYTGPRHYLFTVAGALRALCRNSSITQGLEEVDSWKHSVSLFLVRYSLLSFHCPEITSNASQWAQCTRLGRSRDRFQPPELLSLRARGGWKRSRDRPSCVHCAHACPWAQCTHGTHCFTHALGRH